MSAGDLSAQLHAIVDEAMRFGIKLEQRYVSAFLKGGESFIDAGIPEWEAGVTALKARLVALVEGEIATAVEKYGEHLEECAYLRCLNWTYATDPHAGHEDQCPCDCGFDAATERRA